MVRGQSFGLSTVSLAYITSICSVRRFPGGHSLRLAFGSFSDPPPPLYFYTENQCYRCLVPLAWEVMAGGRGFASHGGVTLSRGGCAIGGSPWTSRAPPPLSDAVVNDYFSHLPHIALYRLWFNVRVSECFSTTFLAYKL